MFDLLCIFSTCRLKSELLQDFITKSSDCECAIFDNLADLASACQMKDDLLILWDFEVNLEGAYSLLDSFSVNSPHNAEKPGVVVVVFNVDPQCPHQDQMVSKGVRGIFYNSDSLSVLQRGLSLVKKGEMWVSRKHLEECVKSVRRTSADQLLMEPMLTRREIEVLQRIATGATNEEIAEDLCISAYTVKTHNYRIYKKIKVNNRMQASLWAINAFGHSPLFEKSPAKERLAQL